MPVSIDKQKRRWRFYFNRVIKGPDGVRRRTRSTKLLPAAWGRAKAEAYDRTETARLYAVATGLEQPEPLIQRAVELYVERRLPQLRKKAKRPSRIIQELAHLTDYIEGRPMSALSEVCHEYAEEHPGFAPATIRNRLAYLRAACRYAFKKHKLTKHDPTGQMELPLVDNARDVRLPVEDYVGQVLKKIEDMETRALYTLTFYTGSRWESEIHPRQPEDVHRVIAMVRGKRKARVLLNVGMTKNGSPRLIPVPPKGRWALAYLPFKWGARYYYDRVRKVLDAAGLDDLVPHDGRHVVATDILLHGGTLPDVSAALHHKHWGSSARYAHLVTEHAERVLGGIGARKVHTPAARRRARAAA